MITVATGRPARRHVHRWGTLGQAWRRGPHPLHRCLVCGERYIDLPFATHEVLPDTSPRLGPSTLSPDRMRRNER